MSSATLPSAPAVSSTIDEQLRLRIAEELAGSFKGDIIGPDHAEYEQARQLWNAMADRRPGLILRCTSTQDVVAAVGVAREHGLPPAIRCGGHNVAGQAMSEGGLTIDLSGLREVTVDPERKLVHVGGGCRLGDVDAATGPHALIVPAGIMSETGEPCIKASTVLPFGAGVQRLIDVEFEDGHRYYTKEAHVADLADDASDKLDAFWRNDMPMEGEIEIIGLGGAIGDVAEADSAFSNRGYLLWLNFAMRWDDPADDPDYIARTRKIVADLAPWTGKGVYVNMLNFDEQDRVEEAMGGPQKYGELGRLKAQFDPRNLFRLNADIPPANADIPPAR